MIFTKMHGAGNDFIILNDMSRSITHASYGALALALCKRRFSIGADGLMILTPPEHGGNFAMHFYNSDGSEGEMCGNGARCVCRYGYEHGLYSKSGVFIETKSGTVRGWQAAADSALYSIRLKEPSVFLPHVTVRVQPGKAPSPLPQLCPCSYLELGSPGLPHAVLPFPDAIEIPSLGTEKTSCGPLCQALFDYARSLRYSPDFPKGANVTFYRVLQDGVFLLTYERGVEDFTLACGTGTACAAVVLAAKGLTSPQETAFYMQGGKLSVSLSLSRTQNGRPAVSNLTLTGPAVTVAHGEFYFPSPPGI